VYPRCDSKHPVCLPRSSRDAGRGSALEHLYPEGAWRRIALSSPWGGASARPLGERSLRTFGFARPWPARASDARRSPCRTNREHRNGWSERFHAPRTPSPHLLRARDLGFRFDCGLGSPFSFETEGRFAARCRLGETSHRSVASVFVITREHHLASRSTLAGSTPPSARCDASPFACERLRGFYAPFADRRRSVVRSLFPFCSRLRARGPDACAEHLVVAPAWPAVRRYRGPARQLFRRGRASACALLSLLSRREREAASPCDEVVSGHEDPPSRAAPRRIGTTRRARGAVSSPPLWRAGPPRSHA